jgi:hypothetical protein
MNIRRKKKAPGSSSRGHKGILSADIARIHVSPAHRTAAKILKGSEELITLTFGSVTGEFSLPTVKERTRNIKAGQAALARAKDLIVVSGVTLNVGSEIPLFHADPDRPDRLVRVFQGRCEHGIFENGQFKVIR